MAFSDKYTIQQNLDLEIEKFSSMTSNELLEVSQTDDSLENEKIVISADAYAIGEQLETLINILRRS